MQLSFKMDGLDKLQNKFKEMSELKNIPAKCPLCEKDIEVSKGINCCPHCKKEFEFTVE